MDYALSSISPCIDAGNPDPLFSDPDDTRNDMGALYLYQTDSAVDEVTWSRMKMRYR